MATIEIRKYSLGGIANHLYYELIDSAGNRIAQINAFGTDPVTGIPSALAQDGFPVRVFYTEILNGVFGDTTDVTKNVGQVIFSGSDADVEKAFSYIKAFSSYIDANGQYLSYAKKKD